MGRRRSEPSAGRSDALYLSQRLLCADLKRVSERARGILVDVGCGNRPYAGFFDRPGVRYVGIDHDPAGSKPSVVATAMRLPLSGASADTVLMTQTLEHVPDPSMAVAEAARILKEDGILLMTAPQAWRLHEEPHDYFRFTRYGLQHLMERHGFEIIELTPQGGAWSLAGQVIANWIEKRGRCRFLIPCVNLLFGMFDRIWPDPGDPINYLVVARRKAIG